MNAKIAYLTGGTLNSDVYIHMEFQDSKSEF